jgi:hypothetical protein
MVRFGYLAYPKPISAQNAFLLLDSRVLTGTTIMIPYVLIDQANYQQSHLHAIILLQNSFTCLLYLVENAFQVTRLSLEVLSMKYDIQLLTSHQNCLLFL